jgi:hypothetical protein
MNGSILSASHGWHGRSLTSVVNLQTIRRFFIFERLGIRRLTHRFAMKTPGMFAPLVSSQPFLRTHTPRLLLGDPPYRAFVRCLGHIRWTSFYAPTSRDPRPNEAERQKAQEITKNLRPRAFFTPPLHSRFHGRDVVTSSDVVNASERSRFTLGETFTVSLFSAPRAGSRT